MTSGESGEVKKVGDVHDAQKPPSAADDRRGACSIMTTALFIAIISIIVAMFHCLWYVGVVSESFSELNLDIDPAALERSIQNLSTFLGTNLSNLIWNTFKGILVTLGIFDIDRFLDTYYNWECNGVKAIIGWLMLLVLVFFVYYILKKEVLFVVQIRWLRYRSNMNIAGRMLFLGLTKLLGGIILYGLQLMVLAMYRLIIHAIKTLGESDKEGCNRMDQAVWNFSPVLVLGSMVIVVMWYLQMMGGSNTRIPIKQTFKAILSLPIFLLCLPFQCRKMNEWKRDVGLSYNLIFHSAKRTVLLTFGWWNTEMVEFYDVQRVAAKYDDDDFDDDSRHQDVISIYGRTRGMLWIILPGCVILTQVAHLVNDPVRWEMSGELNLFFPKWLRTIFYIFNLMRIVLTIIAVISPRPWIILVLLLSVIPPVIASFVYHTYHAIKRQKQLAQEEREREKALSQLASVEERRKALLEHRVARRRAKHGVNADITYKDVLIVRPRNAQEARRIEDEINLELKFGPLATNPVNDVAVREAPVFNPPAETPSRAPPAAQPAHLSPPPPPPPQQEQQQQQQQQPPHQHPQ